MSKHKRFPKQSAKSHEQIQRTNEGPGTSEDEASDKAARRRRTRSADKVLAKNRQDPHLRRRTIKHFYQSGGKRMNPDL